MAGSTVVKNTGCGLDCLGLHPYRAACVLNALLDVKLLGRGAHRVLCEHRAGSSWGKGPNAGDQ